MFVIGLSLLIRDSIYDSVSCSNDLGNKREGEKEIDREERSLSF